MRLLILSFGWALCLSGHALAGKADAVGSGPLTACATSIPPTAVRDTVVLPAHPQKDSRDSSGRLPQLPDRTQDSATGETPDKTGEKRHYVRRKGAGYRIQIFTGGNSRADRQKAYREAGVCRSLFPELSVYTHFESPRWICRVGDFRTAAEAQHYVQKMRKAKAFHELRVVRSTVWLFW